MGLGFRVSGWGFGFRGHRFRVGALGLGDTGLGYRNRGLRDWLGEGLRDRVEGLGLRA